jgi:YggT family protein
MLIDRLIDLYSLVIIGAVVVSWTNVSPDHPAVRLLHRVTEPVLAPVRRALPDVGGVDLSPVVVLVVLQLLGSLF